MFKFNLQLFGGGGGSSGMYTKYSYNSLPKNPRDLERNGWRDVTDPRKPPHVKEYHNPKTGDKVEFHKGRQGLSGNKGKDHYHWRNPNSKNDKDFYLDRYGHPTEKNSKGSHLYGGSKK